MMQNMHEQHRKVHEMAYNRNSGDYLFKVWAGVTNVRQNFKTTKTRLLSVTN